MEQVDQISLGIENNITDLESDFYGNKLIIGTANGKIILCENIKGKMTKTNEFEAHLGPVFKVCWSHPRFCNLIGTCGFDNKINIFKINDSSNFEKLYEYEDKNSSIMTLKFNQYSNDFILLGGTLNGKIIVIKYKNESFITNEINAHDFGVNAICFLSESKFVSCGNDNSIKIWQIGSDSNMVPTIIDDLKENEIITKDISVKDSNNFVSCGEDGILYLWTFNPTENKWKSKTINDENNYKFEKVKYNEEHTCICAINEEGNEILINQEEINNQITK